MRFEVGFLKLGQIQMKGRRLSSLSFSLSFDTVLLLSPAIEITQKNIIFIPSLSFSPTSEKG